MALPVDLVTELDDETVAHARWTLEEALSPDLRDDRFSDAWVRSIRDRRQRFVAATYGDTEGQRGYVGGTLDGNTARLGAIVAPGEDDEEEVLDALLRGILEHLSAAAVTHLELWANPAMPYHESVARQHGLREVRALHQLRCALPVAAEALPTRPFRPGEDDEAVLAVNNRAFATHPDQGGWALDDLRARWEEPWFDPAGLRVHERDGRVIGFCWTKIHRHPDLGEIYVIGVDPDHHGQGLGVPMTAAGLHWLHDQGLRTGMLYVEADNVPALRTYRRLGFTTVRTDRAWERSLP